MLWPITRKKIAQLKAAVAADDLVRVKTLLARGVPIHLAVGGEDCIVRRTLHNENVAVLACLLAYGLRPPPKTACYMALWVERVCRSHGVRRAEAVRRSHRARLAINLLSSAGVDWDCSSASLGSGDTARFVINHAWPGALEARLS